MRRSRCLVAWVLAAAFPLGSSPAEAPSAIPVRCAVIPTGFEGGKYTALVQISVEGSPVSDSSWRLAAEHRDPAGRVETLSARVDVAEPRRRVVYETQVAFAPGTHVLTVEGVESAGGQRGSGRAELTLPDPDARLASITSVTIVQPDAAVFSRDGTVRDRGALARGADEAVSPELATALVSVVCRGPRVAGQVTIDRLLEGSARVSFDPVVLSPGDDPCAQIRDIVPPGTLVEGAFVYEVRVTSTGTRVATERREFRAGPGASKAGS
jgi:hypothetical protein